MSHFIITHKIIRCCEHTCMKVIILLAKKVMENNRATLFQENKKEIVEVGERQIH